MVARVYNRTVIIGSHREAEDLRAAIARRQSPHPVTILRDGVLALRRDLVIASGTVVVCAMLGPTMSSAEIRAIQCLLADREGLAADLAVIGLVPRQLCGETGSIGCDVYVRTIGEAACVASMMHAHLGRSTAKPRTARMKTGTPSRRARRSFRLSDTRRRLTEEQSAVLARVERPVRGFEGLRGSP